MLDNYDDWKLSSGLEKEVVIAECSHCDGEIYEGLEAYQIEYGHWLHEDCLLPYAVDFFQAELKTTERGGF